jgi:hypothetical protein
MDANTAIVIIFGMSLLSCCYIVWLGFRDEQNRD